MSMYIYMYIYLYEHIKKIIMYVSKSSMHMYIDV